MNVQDAYKMTELGEIPVEWEVKSVKDLCPLQRGFDLTSTEVINGNYPVVYSNGILRYHNEYKAKGPGVVTGRSGTIGKVSFVEENYWPHNTALWVTDFCNNHPKFIYFFLCQMHLEKFGTGTGVPTLNRNDVHEKSACIPPLPEQQKIADILSTVDEHITETESLIEKTKVLKQGMMQQLLTKGIGHTEFKDTEIGRIPVEWEVDTIGSICNVLDSKRKPIKSSERSAGIYPYYGASGIIDWVQDYIFDEELILLGEDGENILSRNLPLAFRVSGKCWINNHAHVFCIKSNSRDNIDFVTEVLESKDYSNLAVGSAQPKINQEQCRALKIQRPPLPEQQIIASILTTIDDQIDAYQTKLTALTKLKSALMQQLLTGKTRVKI